MADIESVSDVQQFSTREIPSSSKLTAQLTNKINTLIDNILLINAELETEFVGTENIADDAVTTPKIPDSAVTTVKIADDAVTPAKVLETGDFTVASLTANSQSGCSVSGSKTISSGGTSPSKMTMSSETFDTRNEFDSTTNYRFTAGSAGKYLVCIEGTSNDAFGIADAVIHLYKNGSSIKQVNIDVGDAGETRNGNIGMIVSLVANDYLEVWLARASGSEGCNGAAKLYITRVA